MAFVFWIKQYFCIIVFLGINMLPLQTGCFVNVLILILKQIVKRSSLALKRDSVCVTVVISPLQVSFTLCIDVIRLKCFFSFLSQMNEEAGFCYGLWVRS